MKPSSRHLVAPGSFQRPNDRWAPFVELAQEIPPTTLALVDRQVAKLHPKIARAIRSRCEVLELDAGERAKTSRSLERVCRAALSLPRSGTLLCLGGGTLGDLATVAAHVIKRGVSLVHVPSTLLAAVDSSLGGKGALHVGAPPVKNAIGVFHYAAETWICRELFQTLSEAQLREGRVEALKMAATLSAREWKRFRSGIALEDLIRSARALKAAVCARDPYEIEGHRRVLNFGHTFGHVIETLTRFSVSHGDAVGLGIFCALDVGRAMEITSDRVATEIEDGIRSLGGGLDRQRLARALRRKLDAVPELVKADKKNESDGLRMVLATRLGEHRIERVPTSVWMPLARQWATGVRPD